MLWYAENTQWIVGAQQLIGGGYELCHKLDGFDVSLNLLTHIIKPQGHCHLNSELTFYILVNIISKR